MDAHTLEQCMAASFADTPFPVVVGRLAEAGVISYSADLVALRKTYYNGGSQSHDEAMPLGDVPAIAPIFDAERVAATVKAIQCGTIGYAEFLRRIMAAGCSHYEVFFAGRKAMYFGRDGEFYTEPFPVKAT
ncbi:MAG: DUF1398 family protein [Xanthobacteraceae bacterium]